MRASTAPDLAVSIDQQIGRDRLQTTGRAGLPFAVARMVVSRRLVMLQATTAPRCSGSDCSICSHRQSLALPDVHGVLFHRHQR